MSEEQPESKGITQRLADGFRALLGRAFNSPQLAVRANHLEYDLYLTRGMGSTRIFEAGELDTCRFFFRYEVSHQHEFEFVTSQRPDAQSETYQPFGLLRVKGAAVPIPSLAEVEQSLVSSYGYGLATLPDPRGLLDGRRHSELAAGTYWLNEPPEEQKESGFTAREMLDIIRRELKAPERIAWLEQCFPQPAGPDTVSQRYYLDKAGRVYLVRHHTGGKSLFVAQNDESALQVIWKKTRQAEFRPGA